MNKEDALKDLRFCKCEISSTEFVAHLKHSTVHIAIQVLKELIEIEKILDCCENCISYQGVKEYSESQAYEDILKIVKGTGGAENE